MKKFILLLFLSTTALTGIAQSIKMNEFRGHVNIETGCLEWGPVIGQLSYSLIQNIATAGSISSSFNQESDNLNFGFIAFLLPDANYGLTWIDVEANGQTIETHNPALRFGNWKDLYWMNPRSAVGYHLSWSNKRLPFSLSVGADLGWRRLTLKEGLNAGRHQAMDIEPSIKMNLRLLGNNFERRNGWDIVTDIKASYCYNLKYYGFNDYDPSVLNNGMKYRIGIGIMNCNDAMTRTWSIGWQWEDFDFFNTEFIAPNGTKPFAGYKTKTGTLSVCYRISM